MVGLGFCNLFTGLFQGFPISTSTSRTPIAEAAGAKTQLTGIIGAIAVALVLVWGADLMRNLPRSALAAIVITSAMGLIEVTDLRRIYRIQRGEFWLSIICTASVMVLGAIQGIGIAITIAVIAFLWSAWRPHYAILGRAKGVNGYHNIKRYRAARRVPGLVLFRWDAPLFFANAELFHDCVLNAIASSPTPVRRLIVAAEPVTSIDVTSVDMLVELNRSLRKAGIELCVAGLKDPTKDILKRFGVFEQVDAKKVFFPTLNSAIKNYLKTHSVEWNKEDDA